MAMEGSIRVAPQVLTDTTERFNTLMKEAETLREEMNTNITNMSSVWEGETFNTYKDQFGKLSSSISEKHAAIGKYLSQVKEIANEYITADNTAQAEADSLPTAL